MEKTTSTLVQRFLFYVLMAASINAYAQNSTVKGRLLPMRM